jgi:hypothetical protein
VITSVKSVLPNRQVSGMPSDSHDPVSGHDAVMENSAGGRGPEVSDAVFPAQDLGDEPVDPVLSQKYATTPPVDTD